MSDLVLSTTDAEFEQSVLQEALPVLVDFWAPWCQPCKLIAPVLDSVATQMAGQLKIVKMDVQDNRDVAARYNVRGIPALLLFKEGQVVGTKVGVVSEAELLAFLSEHLGS